MKKEALTDRLAISFIVLLSLGIFAFLIWWIYFKPAPEASYPWVATLPSVNALLNSLTALLLVIGYRLIKQGKVIAHRNAMLSATLTSALFLMSYLTYHYFQGDTKFQGVGAIRYLYFFILISHILLSMVQVPAILTTLYFAFSGKREAHKKIAKWTFPIWLYVSVTGVLIYFFLKFSS